jgi:hypothetical protein
MSSHYGAYATTIEMVERHLQLVDVMLRNKPDVAGFQLYTHKTLNGCYGNPVATGGGDSGVGGLENPVPFLTVNRAATFRSRSVAQKGWGAIGESRRGMARAYFTLDDYSLPGNDIPPDSDQAYIRVQERKTNAGPAASTGLLTITGGVAQVGAFVIMGVSFDGIILPRAGGTQDFNTAISDADAATELIAAINDPASQALLLAAAPAGITVTASPGGTATSVVVTASVTTAAGDAVTLASGGAPFAVSGATLTGGGNQFLSVLGPVNNGDPVLGPIYILPTPAFMNTKLPSLTFAGNAPANTGAVPLAVPPINVDGQNPNPMMIVLPRSCDELTLKNTEAAAGTSLLVSLGPGQPLIEVAAQDSFVVYDGGIKTIVVASTDNGGGAAVAPAFTAVASISLGASR